eukprot:COSAG02_NODE_33589_length_497_cov_14.060302_1_plen_70_part_10
MAGVGDASCVELERDPGQRHLQVRGGVHLVPVAMIGRYQPGVPGDAEAPQLVLAKQPVLLGRILQLQIHF